MSKKYTVVVVYAADVGVEVEADSPQEASEKVWENGRAHPMLCWQCSAGLNLGDPNGLVVLDPEGQLVLEGSIGMQ